MQKEFDLIRKQLEEQAIQYARAYDEDGMEEDFGGLCATNDAMLIVNQVAEEYKSTEHINCSSDDSISRSVLIDKLKKWKSANEERGYDTAKDLVQEMIELVKEQESVGCDDSWIPCSERLPDNTENVLVTTVYGVVLMAYLGTSKKWCYLNGKRIEDSQDTPVAWCELPQPYVKGE